MTAVTLPSETTTLEFVPLHPEEHLRLQVLDELDILDTPAERALDDLITLTSEMLQAPIALLSVVAADRQWFKARRGVDICGTSREVAFCAHAIARDELLLVPNATLDPRFAENPLVRGELGLRFYAGMPIRYRSLPVATLCVAGFEPRTLSDRETDWLRMLAAQAEELLTARVRAREARVFAFALAEERERLRALAKQGQQVMDLLASPLRPSLDDVEQYAARLKTHLAKRASEPATPEAQAEITAGLEELRLLLSAILGGDSQREPIRS